MKKEGLDKYIEHCKYYKGEDEFEGSGSEDAKPNSGLLWFYEMKWVGEYLNYGGIPTEYDGEYNVVGAHFMEVDERPISLKALLFNRYCKTAWSMLDAVEPFMKFHIEYYTEGNLRERLLPSLFYLTNACTYFDLPFCKIASTMQIPEGAAMVVLVCNNPNDFSSIKRPDRSCIFTC